MRLFLLSLSAAALLAASCNNTNSGDAKSGQPAAATRPDITLADFPASPDFPNAKLAITSMSATKSGDSAKLAFAFEVTDYKLKAQTGDAHGKRCNNSDKGQHIHFILDNRPYVALYEPKHEATVPLNSEHYLLCFLSRSYHESVKSPGAMAVAHFKIDANGGLQTLDVPKMPMLFYSRPKGDYLGGDTANILLDFYPVNAALGNDLRVKVDVKNEATGKTASFMLNEWKAHFLQNLGTGKANVSLSFVDKDGKEITGPMSSISRTINLAASEPIK